ncbi:hypothetical protein WA026_005319 [Henosepilachna vigintioctopunctata]|uniref:Uncharacterized protein n=1 Tax=Henosepilachna vigintioctopunctata TaxID=420089 RepID=A0AAW1UTJ7_9CUCU
MNILHAYQLAANYMEEVQQQYDLLLDVLFDRGHIYELLTPAEVAKFIEQATTKLPSKLKILLKPVLKTSVQRSREDIWVTSVSVKMTSTSYWIFEEPSNLIAVDYNNEMFFSAREKLPGEYTNKKLKRIQIASSTKSSIATFQPKRYSVIFNGQRKEVIIKDSGVIKQSQNCVLKTNNIFLTQRITSSVTTTSTAVKPITVNITTHLESLDTTPVIQVDDVLEAIDHPLASVNQESDLHPKIWRKVHRYTTALSPLTFVLCVIADMFIYCLYKMLKTRIQTPSMPNIASDNMSPVSSTEGHRPMSQIVH